MLQRRRWILGGYKFCKEVICSWCPVYCFWLWIDKFEMCLVVFCLLSVWCEGANFQSNVTPRYLTVGVHWRFLLLNLMLMLDLIFCFQSWVFHIYLDWFLFSIWLSILIWYLWNFGGNWGWDFGFRNGEVWFCRLQRVIFLFWCCC